MLIAVITATAYCYEQWGKVGSVLSMPPAEPIGKELTLQDVKNKYYWGGISQASLEDIPTVNYIVVFGSSFKTCKEYYDSLPNLSQQDAASVRLYDYYNN